MKTEIKKAWARRDRTAGFSLIELLIVVFVVMLIAAIVIPNVLLAVANVRLRASAADLAGLMQLARIMTARTNPQVPLFSPARSAPGRGSKIAYIDLNNVGSWPSSATENGVPLGEPLIEFGGTVVPAAGAPSGSGGQPPPYVLAGDTG